MHDPYPTRGSEPGLIERQDPVVYRQPDVKAPSADRERLTRFERDGYLFVPELVPPADVDALLAEAERLRTDAAIEQPENAFFESGTTSLRSLFAVHRVSETFASLCEDDRVLNLVRSILGDDVYVHQSRLNYKPAFRGREFYWHSDFETWHAEDGMPRMRALSLSVSLTPTLATNGPLMIVPGSHHTFISCAGTTPSDHYRESLVEQRVGTPDEATVARLARRRGIKAPTGGAGSAVFFDCNVLHGSNGNITPFPRTNLFVVYNAVSNALTEPFAAPAPRPEFVGAREHVEILPRRHRQ
ncbi:MAG: ectoine hydroxylase [Pseudomonadales bacterium]